MRKPLFLLALVVWTGCEAAHDTKRRRLGGQVAVETATVERGSIQRLEVFSGALEASRRFVVVPKVQGRVEALSVDLGDTVRLDTPIAKIEDAEFIANYAAARAGKNAARARLSIADNDSKLANRELARLETLKSKGVISVARLETAGSASAAAKAEADLAQAELERAAAQESLARLRLGYTKVAGPLADDLVVAERHVSVGATVGANTALVTLVDLDPLLVVVFAPEAAYRRLRSGQRAFMTTDACPGEGFEGRVARIAPVFDPSSRQARVEVHLKNTDGRLRPGMFVELGIEIETLSDATIVPLAALTRRNKVEGVFKIGDDGATVRWVPTEVRVKQGERVALTAALVGQVVTLGQHLLSDGATVKVTNPERP